MNKGDRSRLKKQNTKFHKKCKTSPLDLIKFSNRMRSCLTPYEQEFKNLMNTHSIDYKVQVVLGFYIVDFVIPSKMICIEIDGSQHDFNIDYDTRRSVYLSNLGFTVLRLKNNKVSSFDIKNISCIPDCFDVRIFNSAVKEANKDKLYSIKKIPDLAFQPEKIILSKNKRNSKEGLVFCKTCGNENHFVKHITRSGKSFCYTAKCYRCRSNTGLVKKNIVEKYFNDKITEVWTKQRGGGVFKSRVYPQIV